jgi:hypothetical protein
MTKREDISNAEANGSAAEELLEEAESLLANLRAAGASRADFAAALKAELGSAATDDAVAEG